MTAHEHSLRLPVPPSHIQLACNGVFIALPHGRNAVGIWSLQDITCKPLELEGHRKPLTSLAFSQKSHPTLLCSAALDYVIVWNIEKARSVLDTGQQIRGTVVGTTLGFVQHTAFDPDDNLVAVCVDKEVHVLETRREETRAVLEGHTARVNAAEFCPHYSSTLVTAGDDRTFKVWDISSCAMLYQSAIISSSPFISLVMNPMQEAFALGTSDGMVRVYDLTDGNGFRCLHQLDVSKLTDKIRDSREALQHQTSAESKGPVTISSRPKWQQSDLGASVRDEGSDSQDQEDETEIGCSILSMLYTWVNPVGEGGGGRTPTPARLGFLRRDDSLVSDLLQSAPMLVIGTTGSLIQLNARTLEPAQYTSFQDPMPSNSLLEDGGKALWLAGNIIMGQDAYINDKVWCVIGSMFHHEVHITSVTHPSPDDTSRLKAQLARSKRLSYVMPSATEPALSTVDGATAENGRGDDAAHTTTTVHQLSVLSSAPLVPNSPLKAELHLKSKDKLEKKPTVLTDHKHRTGQLDKKGHIVDKQPVVFRPKIQSSGYSTVAPRRQMFQPKTNGASAAKLKPQTAIRSPSRAIIKEYPMGSKPASVLTSKMDVAERPTAINIVKFSDDGQSVACALANTTAQIFKLPLSGKGCALAGHLGNVTGVSWSHDSRWLVTSGDDKMAAVWSLGIPDPVMTITHANNNFGADKEGGLKADKSNPTFSKPVKSAQFYYMDKFLLLTSGNSLSLYKYHLDTSKSDIKRYLSNNRYKLVKSFQLEQSHQITALSAVNSFYSYIVLCAGSDKSLEVFDLNVGQSVCVIPEVHSRAAHVVCQNQGSPYVSHPSSAYDLFVTAAASDCIKLWDLRSSRCVRRYEGHCNRSQPCGLAISPCSRYIATGSEDRSAYIFDIRSGTYIHKLTGHTDTVSDVAFHPLYPQLLTATLDGKLRLFKDR